MKGRVKNVNEDREFGFILGEDGIDYFFHYSNVSSVDLPTKNSIVEFEVTQTEKGCSATNIKVEDRAVKKPEFVKFGSVRIRLKNIKSSAIYSGYKDWEAYDHRFVEVVHLKIETYQGDVFRFTQANCDIYAKQAELDKYFTE